MALIITLMLFAPISNICNMALPLLTFVGAVQEKQEGPETVPPEPFKSHGNFLRFCASILRQTRASPSCEDDNETAGGDYLSVPQMLQKQKTPCF